MKKIPHLVQYQGSKRNLASEILKYLPVSFGRLVEPFAGSAAITIACATESKANEFLVNDLNKPLIELLKLVIEKPEYTAKKYREIWIGKKMIALNIIIKLGKNLI